MKVFYDSKQIINIEQLLTQEQINNVVCDLISENFDENKIISVISIKEAEQLLNKEVEKILDEYDYDNIGDVKVYADDETSPFYEEAKAILDWYKNLWNWFYEFMDGKNEVDYKEFEAEYPAFEE